MKLAINGGNKVFKDEIRECWPKITPEIEKAVVEQLYDTISIYDRSGIIEQMEVEFSKYHSKEYGLLTNSGTSAIHSALNSLNLNKNDEIIFPAYTFFATASPVFHTGAIPVLVDCDENGNIDPEKIKNAITSKTKAVVVTHMWGYPVDYKNIKQICEDNNLIFLEDCSHAHGAKIDDIVVGSLSDISMFSLQGSKIVTGGEGGILLTDDINYYSNAVMLGHYNKRCKQEIPEEHPLYRYSTTGLGLKLRSHPIAVRIAYQIFKDLPEINRQKNIVAAYYQKELENIDGIELIKVSPDTYPSWYTYIFKYTGEEKFGVSREKILNALLAEGCLDMDIPNSTCPLSHLPLFQYPKEVFKNYEDKIYYSKDDFPKANEFYNSILKMPVWQLEDFDVAEDYIKAIKKVFSNINELK